jgi:hypothetical protein
LVRKRFVWVIPHQYCVVPVAAGVLNPQTNAPATVGASVGAAVGAGDGIVGAIVGGSDPPGMIEIVSIEMSPEVEVPRVAVHCTDVVPARSGRTARVQALVSAACCAPVWVHCVVHTVPTQVCTLRDPMVAPAMW